MIINKLSLFSGIGGDDLASEWAGIKTIAFVERDSFCQQVLKKHWPDIPIIGDVKDVTKDSFKGQSIEIISGGFPCQPHSVAGKRKGSSDERDLWPEFRRIISEIKPRWVVGENVPGLLSSNNGYFFGSITEDMASMGYSIGWCTIRAIDTGAPHKRERIFFMAHTDNKRCVVRRNAIRSNTEINRQDKLSTSSTSNFSGGWWETEPSMGRVANGVPNRLDRIRVLGNAVVPQQIYPIYKAIVEIETGAINAQTKLE